MAITQKDFEALQSGVNTLTSNRMQAQQAERDAELKRLLLGDQANADLNRKKGEMDYQIQQAKSLRQELGPEVGVNVEGVSIQPRDQLRAMQLKEMQARQGDQALTKVGERVAKADLPTTFAAAANLEKGTAGPSGLGMIKDPNYEVKGAGPVANMVRSLPGGQGMLNIGERVGLMPKGASQETALAQRLMNMDIKNLSGTAVSAAEQGRQNIEKGLSAGGDPNLVKLG